MSVVVTECGFWTLYRVYILYILYRLCVDCTDLMYLYMLIRARLSVVQNVQEVQRSGIKKPRARADVRASKRVLYKVLYIGNPCCPILEIIYPRQKVQKISKNRPYDSPTRPWRAPWCVLDRCPLYPYLPPLSTTPRALYKLSEK